MSIPVVQAPIPVDYVSPLFLSDIPGADLGGVRWVRTNPPQGSKEF